MTSPASRTTAATTARRAATTSKLHRVRDVLRQMTREHASVTFAAVARRSDVSRTFLYQHPDARKLVDDAIGATATRRARSHDEQAAQIEASWRERALNAEERVSTAYREFTQQRSTISDLLGRIRDLETDLPEDSVQRLATENTTLTKQVHELTQDNHRLHERLRGARDNTRFLDKRVADLEAQLLPMIAP